MLAGDITARVAAPKLPPVEALIYAIARKDYRAACKAQKADKVWAAFQELDAKDANAKLDAFMAQLPDRLSTIEDKPRRETRRQRMARERGEIIPRKTSFES